MKVISKNEVKIGLQYLTIPQGKSLIDVVPFETKNQYSEVEDCLHFYKHKQTIICERITQQWNIQTFGIGTTIEEAELDSEYNGIYFDNNSNGLSWMIRNIMKIAAKNPTIPNVENCKKFNISNCEVGYATGFMDTKIIVFGINSAYVFQYSGDESYPLGTMLWGQRWTAESHQYLGSSKSIGSNSCLIWQLNDNKLDEVILHNPVLQRPTTKNKKVITVSKVNLDYIEEVDS